MPYIITSVTGDCISTVYIFYYFFTLSVPSQQTTSQTEFQDAMANLNVQSNATILSVRVV